MLLLPLSESEKHLSKKHSLYLGIAKGSFGALACQTFGSFYLFIYFLLSIVASTLPEVNIASGLLCQTSNIVFCSLRMKNFRIIPFFLTLSPNQPDQPDHCSAQHKHFKIDTQHFTEPKYFHIQRISNIPHIFEFSLSD